MNRRKRILFVTPPGYGHIFPVIPFAWSFRIQGHDVLVATCGVSTGVAVRAGIPAINVAPGADLPALIRRFSGVYRETFHNPDTQAPVSSGLGDTAFTVIGDAMTDPVIRVVEKWKPHLIVYTPYAGAGAVAASKYLMPSVFLGISLAYVPKAMMEFTYSRMTPACERHHVSTIREPTTWIDVAPPSLRTDPLGGWPMRYVPFHGAEILETVALDRSATPCVAVTFGTLVPLVAGAESLKRLIVAAGGLPAEFVIAHGSPDAHFLPNLPPNVKAKSWIPLDHLLASSDMIVHHGGAGCMFAALCAGIPQMVVPHASDQFYNAAALRQRRVAVVLDVEGQERSRLESLLSEPLLLESAHQVSEEIAAMAGPMEVAQRALALAD